MQDLFLLLHNSSQKFDMVFRLRLMQIFCGVHCLYAKKV